MLRFKLGVAVIVLSTALSTAAYAAPAKGGGGGGHAGGGGGHPGGGGGHAGGGGHPGGGGGGMHVGGGHPGGGGGAHFGGGGGRHISGRSAISRSVAQPSSHGNRAAVHTPVVHTPANNSVGERTPLKSTGNATRNANVNPNLRSHAVRNTLNSAAVAGVLHNRDALRHPNNRAHITASAAMAGWHNGHGNGWWRHGSGGYGWVGPLYWPFAYYDLYDYAMWGPGYDNSFWGYGYGDIYAGIFAPYGYDDLTGYLPQRASSNSSDVGQPAPAPVATAAPDQLAQMCGEDSRDIAGLPIDQFKQAIQPTDEQSSALDDLANASVKAAQDIRAACPADIALTAPSRLAAMQQRIEAMIAAVQTVQPPLEKFYGLLSDEQKARLTALGNDERQSTTTDKAVTGSLDQNCGAAQPGVMEWPTAEIDQTVHPTDAQRVSLVALQNATAQAADLLKASCVSNDPLTPPARLAAVGQQLDTMLQAVKIVSSALNDFYGTLSDEQKAQFEAIGPQRMTQLKSPEVAPTTKGHGHRHHGGSSVERVIRRLMYRL